MNFTRCSYLTLLEGIGAITRLCVSPDGCTLFSAGEDGCVFLFDVHAMENGEPLPRRITEPSAFSDVVLTTRAEVLFVFVVVRKYAALCMLLCFFSSLFFLKLPLC